MCLGRKLLGPRGISFSTTRHRAEKQSLSFLFVLGVPYLPQEPRRLPVCPVGKLPSQVPLQVQKGSFWSANGKSFAITSPIPRKSSVTNTNTRFTPRFFTRSWNTSAQKALVSFPHQNQKPRISFLPSRSIPTATNRVIPCSFPSSVRSLANASMKMVNQSPLRGCVL